MKKWLLVLLVLGAAVPAVADVFIYNSKMKGTGYEYNEGYWTKYKGCLSGYVVLEPNNVDANFVKILSVDFWQGKTNYGIMHKYYNLWDVITLELIKAQAGKNLIWVIPLADNGNKFLLTGPAKMKKVGTNNYVIPATLTGYFIWHKSEVNYRDDGAGPLLLTLNSKMTTNWHALSGENAMNAIIAYLESLGYIPEPD